MLDETSTKAQCETYVCTLTKLKLLRSRPNLADFHQLRFPQIALPLLPSTHSQSQLPQHHRLTMLRKLKSFAVLRRDDIVSNLLFS